MISAFSQPLCAPRVRRFGSCRRLLMPYAPERERWQLGRWRRGTGGRVRRQQSRDSCDSVAFARARARRGAYRIARSRRSAVPYTTWTKRRQRAGQPRSMGGSFLRSQSCDIPRRPAYGCVLPKIGHYRIYSNLKKNARSAVFLNRTHQLYNTLGSQGQPKTFDFVLRMYLIL